MRALEFKPILLLLLFIAAAFAVIGIGPSFVPMAHTFDRVEPAICKVLGGSLMFLLTWLFIRRDGEARGMLDLAICVRNMGMLCGWTLVAAVIILLWCLLLRGLMPFHIEAGTLTVTGLALSFIVYLFGSITEELAFRGYPLLRLYCAYGRVAGVVIVSLAFGLFHFPGMHGLALLKTVAITSLCSVIYCLGFLRTGTLWSAIGLHAGMNITLHSVLGAGDPNRASLLRIVADGPALTWDAWFWSFMVVGTAAAACIGLAGHAYLPRRARCPERRADTSDRGRR